jgi:thymidine kinase
VACLSLTAVPFSRAAPLSAPEGSSAGLNSPPPLRLSRSGKTTELLRRTRRLGYARKRCLVVKYKADTRYSDADACTHDGVTHVAVAASSLADLGEMWHRYDVISIDEGQFFVDVVEFCEKVAQSGRCVLVCGLDADFRRRKFGRLCDLLPLAEQVDKLTSVCAACGADASFTRRLTSEESVEVIGGWESYRPCCRRCHGIPQAEFEAADAAIESASAGRAVAHEREVTTPPSKQSRRASTSPVEDPITPGTPLDLSSDMDAE